MLKHVEKPVKHYDEGGQWTLKYCFNNKVNQNAETKT